MERLGLDYERLRAVNPRIIVARLKGFGLSGSVSRVQELRHDRPGDGRRDERDRLPRPRARAAAAPTSATAAPACTWRPASWPRYIERQRTGQGQVVEVSMQEAVANLIRQRYVDHYRDNKPTPRRGNGAAARRRCPTALYPCAPGGPNDYVYIYVQPMNQGMWQRLRARDRPRGPARRSALRGRADTLGAPRGAERASRARGRARARSRRCWRRSARRACRAARSWTRGEVLDDPHLNARGAIDDHRSSDARSLPACPAARSACPSSEPVTTPPAAGRPAHRRRCWREVLGLSPQAVAELRARAVI